MVLHIPLSFEVVGVIIVFHLCYLFSFAHPLSSMNLHLCNDNNTTS